MEEGEGLGTRLGKVSVYEIRLRDRRDCWRAMIVSVPLTNIFTSQSTSVNLSLHDTAARGEKGG